MSDSGFLSQIFGAVNPASVLLGLAHLTGFVALILVCLGIGFKLLRRGLFPERKP